MAYSCVQLNGFPDEILMIIFKKLNNVEVLYSLLGANKRFNQIVNDSTFTSSLILLKCLPHNSIYPLSDPILDRFCCEIVPQIHHKVKWLTVESLSMKRIFVSGNYHNLDGLTIYNIGKKTALYLFTEEMIHIIHKLKDQILSLVIGTVDKHDDTINMNTFIFTNIFKNFTNLKYLNFDPPFICNQLVSFNMSSPTVFSSTLLTLHIKVLSMDDCLYLLDGRFNQLHTFYVQIESSFSHLSLQINQEKLPNLRCFSLFCAKNLDFDKIIIPLLHRMSNLEILILYFAALRKNTFINGNHLKNIINHMPQLNKFLFNIRSFTSLKNQINLPSNEDVQYTFRDFKNNQIISCVDYFPEAQEGQCYVYSYPFTLKHYYGISNHFSGGIFKCVREVSLFDEYPFEHEFFLQIAQSFPLLEKLSLYNKKPQNNKQYRKSKEDMEHLSIIEYPHLTKLMLYDVHYDYIEEFLIDTKICLTYNICLQLNYKPLKKVTRNFKRNATRMNCSKVNRLYVAGKFKMTERLKNYFPHAEILYDYYGFLA